MNKRTKRRSTPIDALFPSMSAVLSQLSVAVRPASTDDDFNLEGVSAPSWQLRYPARLPYIGTPDFNNEEPLGRKLTPEELYAAARKAEEDEMILEELYPARRFVKDDDTGSVCEEETDNELGYSMDEDENYFSAEKEDVLRDVPVEGEDAVFTRQRSRKLLLRDSSLTYVPMVDGSRYVDIDLSRNALETLDSFFMPGKDFSQMRKLDICMNKIQSLPTNFGEVLYQLEHFNVRGNLLITLPLSMGHMLSLKWLCVRHNPLNKMLRTVVGPCSTDEECRKSGPNLVRFMQSLTAHIYSRDVLTELAQRESLKKPKVGGVTMCRESSIATASPPAYAVDIYNSRYGATLGDRLYNSELENMVRRGVSSSMDKIPATERFKQYIAKPLLYFTCLSLTGTVIAAVCFEDKAIKYFLNSEDGLAAEMVAFFATFQRMIFLGYEPQPLILLDIPNRSGWFDMICSWFRFW